MVTTVFRLGGVDTDEAERFQFEEPERYAALDLEARRVIGGSWDYWWLKTPLPGIVWCNCPHMTGLDGLKVEDLTRAEFEGRRRIHAMVDHVRAKLPGFAQLLRRRCRAADRRAADPDAGGRVRRDQGGRARSGVHFADSIARGRDYYTPYRALLPQRDRPVAGRRPALFRDAAGAEDLARDPALHGDGRGRRHRRRDGAVDAGATVREVDVRRAAADAARAGRRPGRPAVRRGARGMTRCSARSAAGTPPASQPLSGVRVVDFTQVMMGPCATQMLGDYGADVIKIERIGAGDLSRWSIGDDPAGPQNPVFCSLNRNKRSIALDLEIRRRAWRSCTACSQTADVVVNNFRAGVMERMGLGYDALHASISAADLCRRHRLRHARARTPTKAARTSSRRR